MKKKDFLEELGKELDSASPEMSDSLRKYPISVQARPTPEKSAAKSVRRRRKGLFAAVACTAAAVCACAVLLPLFAQTGAPAVSCLYIDINPSLALTLDENNKVRKAVSRNTDGDVLAADEAFASSLVGMDASDAAVAVAEQAAKNGYFELFNEGSETDYNEISVTLKSTADTKEELSGIRNSLVGYFCEEGIYVYVNAEGVTDDSAKSERDALEERPASYTEWVGSQSDEALTMLTEQTAYDYASDLLEDALFKYDLFAEIDELDRQIQEDPDNPLGLSYWLVNRELNDNVRTLSAQMQKKLEALYLLYGIDGRSSLLAYTAARTAYTASVALADVDALRALSEAGINDETFGGLQNLGVRVNYFCFVSNDLLSDLAAEIWNTASVVVEGLLDDLEALITDRAQTLSRRFSGLFELPRETIGEADYLSFLGRIGK